MQGRYYEASLTKRIIKIGETQTRLQDYEKEIGFVDAGGTSTVVDFYPRGSLPNVLMIRFSTAIWFCNMERSFLFWVLQVLGRAWSVQFNGQVKSVVASVQWFLEYHSRLYGNK